MTWNGQNSRPAETDPYGQMQPPWDPLKQPSFMKLYMTNGHSPFQSILFNRNRLWGFFQSNCTVKIPWISQYVVLWYSTSTSLYNISLLHGFGNTEIQMQYRDHLVGQLTSTILDIPDVPGSFVWCPGTLLPWWSGTLLPSALVWPL